MSEKILNVPLDEDIRKKLDERADENGRATSREAAAIITNALRKTKKA